MSPNVDELVEYLNSLVEVDRDFMHNLSSTRFACNEAMRDHPTVQCGRSGMSDSVAGFVGVVNGYLGKQGTDLIAAAYADDGKLAGFVRFFSQG